MKIYLIYFVISLLLIPIALADDEEIPVVEYQICDVDSDENKSKLQEFFDKTNTYLQNQAIQITFEETTQDSCQFSSQDTINQILFYDTSENEPSIKVRLSATQIHKVSAILGNDLIIEIPLNHDKSEEFFASLLLYSIGEIDHAETLLLQFQADEAYKELQTEIAYYLSNVAIMKGDISLAGDRFPDGVLATGKFYTTNFAWILLQLGGDVEAIDVMSDAIKVYHDMKEPLGEIDSLVDRANLYALSFNYTNGIADMDSAIELAQENDYSDTELAILFKQRGDIIMLIYEWNRAYDDYNKAIELDATYAEAYYRRGILFYTWFEREKAIGDFQTYLELESDGQFAESANQYIGDIQTEIDALSG